MYSPKNIDRNLQIECFVPIWIQRALDNLGSLRLFSIEGRHRERIWKAYENLH